MGLRQNMASEPVSKLDLREPVLCGPAETVRDAILKMRERRLGCVIVVDIYRKPLGMFTESKLTQLLADNPEAVNDVIGNHLEKPWPWVMESDPISLVLEDMQLNNVRFIGVLNTDGQVVGLTGQKGLMEYISEHFPQQVMVQRVGSRPPAEREGA
ncbi:CBS domain-containing protein [Aeoliella mucimassa]|uniref:CBS domain protein n=1 Tax=Aeoliella mucimassa TaxID=2527972 RepID=A0A518AQ53_9BACT|nr:CBS domain-containing protein [Aeoliella mucimassa]QDU56843.1 CBS domain protein [Aeoliella mucimassa]